MDNFLQLAGKRIIVAGASSGIGLNTAFLLNKYGAKVILVARSIDKLKEAVENMQGDSNAYYAADLSNISNIEYLVKKIIQEQGKIDGLVYAAGISMSIPLQLFKPEKLHELFRINYYGFVECVRQVCKNGRYNGGMRIVGVSSIASIKGDSAHLGYSASKAAMDASVRCIAKEVASKGICINTVAPAMTATNLYYKFLEKYGEESNSNKAILERQYLGIAEPIDIANAIVFLISPASRFITGITLPVDGGLTTS